MENTTAVKQKKKSRKHEENFNAISVKSNVIINIFFILVCLVSIFPIILIFMVSITDQKSLLEQGYTIFPKVMSFETYNYLFSGSDRILSAYGITIETTVLGTLISVAMTMLYAYPISRSSFKYRNVFAFILFFTMLFQGGLVPWYILYCRYLNLRNTLMALIMPGFLSAFNVLIVRTFFRNSIPEEILEAAKVDGAGEFYTFIKIVLPLSTPALATVGLFQTLYYWNDWYNCMLFITDEKLFNMQYSLYEALRRIEVLASSSVQNAGVSNISQVPSETLRMAMAIIGVGPIVLAYPFFQRYFVKGLTIGAVKG